MSRLSAASLRITESLDLESVLREVVDSARVLTGAANAVTTTVEPVEQARDFISSGSSAEERRQLRDLPRDERRARADLEALVDTSPVGVAVFDAKTGELVRFNREGRRMVAGWTRRAAHLRRYCWN